MKKTTTLELRKFGLTISGPPLIFIGPEIICLYSTHARLDTIRFLEAIHSSQNLRPRRLVVDLSRLKYMSGAAALVLFSNISRIRLRAAVKDLVVLVPPSDREQKRLFAASKLQYALSLSPSNLQKLTSGYCDFTTSCDPESHYKHTCEVFEKTYSENQTFISTAVQEAMINVVDHAYENVTADISLYNRWWQYSYILGQKFNFIIYDLGRGIPTAMRDMAGSSSNDAELLRTAMITGVTSTGIRGRGKGSADIKRVVDKMPTSELLIFSQNAIYRYDSVNKESSEMLPYSLSGTLVQWVMPLN